MVEIKTTPEPEEVKPAEGEAALAKKAEEIEAQE